MRWLIRLQGAFPGISSASELINTLVSNLVKRGAVALTVLIMALSILAASMSMPQVFSRMTTMVASENAGAWMGRLEHYRDYRKGLDRLLPVPSIASQELGDAPLRLFMPLRRDRHPEVLSTRCPQLAPLQDDARGHAQAALDCLHEWSSPQLDGQPLPQHERIFSVDPHSGLQGVLWRVPNELIEPGRHVLSLHVRDAPEGSKPPHELQIVFFK